MLLISENLLALWNSNGLTTGSNWKFSLILLLVLGYMNEITRSDMIQTWLALHFDLVCISLTAVSLGFLNPLLPGITQSMIRQYFVMPGNKQMQVLEPVNVLSE